MMMAVAVDRAEAFVFRSLVSHLQSRSQDVSNIDLMNLSGFCRNCLSKWYLMGARSIAATATATTAAATTATAAAWCASLTYDDACARVYGMGYADWKKQYQKKATASQMAVFEEGKRKGLHATHSGLDIKSPPAPPQSSRNAAQATCRVIRVGE